MNKTTDYLLGIKGVGMTALAGCLIDAGHRVLGADQPDDFVTAGQLNSLHIHPDLGYSGPLDTSVDRVIMSTALNPTATPLVATALERRIPVVSHAQALAELAHQQAVVAVCGVGGKSTVSAMLAYVGSTNQIACSYAVGVGDIIGLDRTGVFNPDADYFIVEADEYADNPYQVRAGAEQVRPRFAVFQPQIVICTNLQYDHPDVYPSFAKTKQAFFEFFCQMQQNGTLIWHADDLDLPELVDSLKRVRPDIKTLSYGEHTQADFVLKGCTFAEGVSKAQLNHYQLQISLPGIFNLRNASAALIAAQVMNWDTADTLTALAKFESTSRRCQLIKQIGNTLYYDDYAHHPHEVKAILDAIRSWYPQHQLTAVFQPHTVSRSKTLLTEFGQAFISADQVIVLPIFASARETTTTDDDAVVQQLVNRIAANRTNQRLSSADSFESAHHLISHPDTKQVVITLGAGDVYKLHDILP